MVERHLKASTILTSNREPGEWIAVMSDPLLAQSAIDRLQSAAFELVVEGQSYRKRQKPRIGSKTGSDQKRGSGKAAERSRIGRGGV